MLTSFNTEYKDPKKWTSFKIPPCGKVANIWINMSLKPFYMMGYELVFLQWIGDVPYFIVALETNG